MVNVRLILVVLHSVQMSFKREIVKNCQCTNEQGKIMLKHVATLFSVSERCYCWHFININTFSGQRSSLKTKYPFNTKCKMFTWKQKANAVLIQKLFWFVFFSSSESSLSTCLVPQRTTKIPAHRLHRPPSNALVFSGPFFFLGLLLVSSKIRFLAKLKSLDLLGKLQTILTLSYWRSAILVVERLIFSIILAVIKPNQWLILKYTSELHFQMLFINTACANRFSMTERTLLLYKNHIG